MERLLQNLLDTADIKINCGRLWDIRGNNPASYTQGYWREVRSHWVNRAWTAGGISMQLMSFSIEYFVTVSTKNSGWDQFGRIPHHSPTRSEPSSKSKDCTL
ncbi:hypothetical protein ACFL6P_05495 [Candidatus Latescibacterota bacterium]